jgi:hypothetical protein
MADTNTPKKTPYGFIIYRGDYKDDAKWERFMAYLKQETRRNLESDGTPEQWDRMDWKVMVYMLPPSKQLRWIWARRKGEGPG